MLLLRTLTSPTTLPQAGVALTIGNFDGVHVGHQRLLRELLQGAQQLGVTPAVMTFEPHPRELFRPLDAPPRVQLLRDKAAALAAHGVELLIIAPFERLRHLGGEAFVQQLLIERLRTRLLVVGDDFHFGKGRDGNVALLRRFAAQGAFELRQLASVQQEGHRVSSSNVRHALRHAEFARAAALLGRPYCISGHVVRGRQLGRTLGYPTLNLRIAHDRPALGGVFCVLVHGLDAAPLPGLASLGRRPTVQDQGRALLETYVLDWPATQPSEQSGLAGLQAKPDAARHEVYGRLVSVEFLHKIRDEARFADLPALVAAMHQDETHAREYFANLKRQTTRDRISC